MTIANHIHLRSLIKNERKLLWELKPVTKALSEPTA